MAVTEGNTNLPIDGSGLRYFQGYLGPDGNFYIPRAIGSANSGLGTLRVSNPLADFSIQHTPGGNAQATISQASAGGSIKNVASAVCATLVSTGATAFQGTVNLRDGASGAGTIKWAAQLAIPSTADSSAVVRQTFPNPIPGTAATAMTLEFSATSGSANVQECVSLQGMQVT